MFFSLKNKKSKKEVALVLDVGSGSVAGAFVEFVPGQESKILYVKRVPIKFNNQLSGNRFKKEMFKSLETVSENLIKEGLVSFGHMSKDKIRKVYCSLASPWFVSQTKEIRIKEEKPFTVSSRFISDLLKREEEDFEESNLSKYGSKKRESAEIIERKLVDVKLNGYKIDDPLGKKTSEVEFSLFMSLSQSDVLDNIEDIVSKYFNVDEFDFHSFALVSFSAVRDMFERVSGFLLLDITGEVTDVSLIKSGKILNTTSFPLGRNSLVREISKKFKTSAEEASSSLRLLISDSLGAKRTKSLNTIVDKSREAWAKEFQKSLLSLSEGVSLPATVFFTADEDISSLYSSIIKSEEFAQNVLTDRSFIVSFINFLSLDSYVFFRTSAEKDTFIALESIFFSRIFELKE